ncbi:MAG: hypothetical protein AVDCRST_MAG43-473 [uncultured Thermomicrobiales bacterium]|uniref:Uncharacterized protein n=1 Tax=uncultured Thermomicrobiales bacterium TaxID=1645740 RepID=A0A6J4UAB9_9BACT|nr:MAG: hypothetical protein AVDCRST_MAG43-473 [uncultured Thermomicrobiales bacterium]
MSIFTIASVHAEMLFGTAPWTRVRQGTDLHTRSNPARNAVRLVMHRMTCTPTTPLAECSALVPDSQP